MAADHVNLAVVGLGGWGRYVVRNFADTPNCRLRYVCDLNRATLSKQARQYRDAVATDSCEQVLADPSLDAVALITPAPTHYALVRQALLAGKHVFVEKPMTLCAEHAEELIELADREQRKLMVGHLLEYHPAVELMKRELAAGSLGRIYYMYCQRLNLGVVRHDENAFWSLAPHDLSVVLHLFDGEPQSIEASGQDFLQDGVEDVVFASLRFADGRMAHIHVSWLDPCKTRSMVLVGSEKMLVFDDMQPTEKIRIFDKSASAEFSAHSGLTAAVHVRHGDILIPRLPAQEPLAIETSHFVECILNDTPPRSDGRDGLRVVRVLEAVDRRLRAAEPLLMRRAA